MGKVIFEKPDFTVVVSEESDSAACLALSGDPTSSDFLFNMEDVEQAIEDLPHTHLLLDIHDTKTVNSRFVILLLSLYHSGKVVGLKHPPRILYDLLEMLGILHCFEVFEDFQGFVEKSR